MPTTINPSGQTITQYNLQTGGTNNLLNNVAPSATSGVPLISQGASAQPAFGTVVVGGGGTGVTTMGTTYAPICASTTVITTTLTSAVTPFVSQGTSTVPLFQTVDNAGSGWTRIATVTASASSSLTITSGISTTFTDYVLVFDNVVLSTPAFVQFQISSDGGGSYKTSGYLSGLLNNNYNGTTLFNNNTTGAFYICGGGSTFESSGCVYLNNFTNNANYPGVCGNSLAFDHSTNCFPYIVTGGYTPTIVVNAIKILSSSGTLTTGDFTLFGFKK